MTDIVESARLLWTPHLSKLVGKPKIGVQEWLASATYAPMVVGSELWLTGIDGMDLLGAYGADINRTSSAGSETLRNIVSVPTMPKSSAWCFVKLYYSALFYSHCLLRICGRSHTYFRTSELLVLRSSIKTYGVSSPFKMNTGQYLLLADAPNDQVCVQLDNSGGSHEVVWRSIVALLESLRTAVQGANFTTIDKSRIISQLSSGLMLITNNSASSSWPSTMRNDIQYRQDYGLWYPYIGKTKSLRLQTEVSSLLAKTTTFDTLSSTSGDELGRLWAACSFLILLTRGVLEDLAQIGGAKSFLQYGQSQFEMSIAA